MDTKKRSIVKQCAVLWLAYVCLAWLFPYTGDDWSWGSSIGLERLGSFFAGYNGRYAGNLLVLALTRSKLLDAAIMAASFCMICFLSYQYSQDKAGSSLLLAAALYFLMPKDMWAQIAVWTAGFTNYVPSALITVAFLVLTKEITAPELSERQNSLVQDIGVFLLGLVGALFVESITVFHICLAVAVILWMFLKFRKCRRVHIAFLAGSVVGACVMFSNGAYNRIAQGEDYYRHMPGTFRDTVYFAVDQAGNILDYIIYGNLWFCVIVTALLLCLAVWSLKSGERKKIAVLPAMIHGCSLLALWQKDAIFDVVTGRISMKALIAGFIPIAVAVLYVLSIIVMVLCFVEKGRRFRMLLPLYCAVVSLAPLLIVDPIGPRCVFIGYFLMVVFTVDLFGYFRRKVHLQEKVWSRLIGVVVAAQFLFYLSVFYPIHHYDLLRLDAIKQQAAEGKTEVFMCDLPNTEYVWDGTPAGESWINKYKLFYGLGEELQLTVIPYYEMEVWINGDS